MSRIRKSTLLQWLLVGLCMAGVSMQAQGKKPDKKIERAKAQASNIAPSFEVRRTVDDELKMFGEMITTFDAATGQGPICIEIDFARNEGGDQYPTDISDIVRSVLEKMPTDQLCTFKTLPSASASPKNAAIAYGGLIASRPRPPSPTFRLVGWLEGAQQTIVKSSDGRIDGTGGGGHTSTDGSGTGDRDHTITELTVSLTLERADGVAVKGATAEFRVYLEQQENKHSFSLYVGGNGFGFGKDLKVTQNNIDGLFEVTAHTIMKVMGEGMNLPYTLCSTVFAPDTVLAERVRGSFERSTQSELERLTKRYMIVSGYGMQRDQGAELTATDRAVVSLEMRRQSIVFSPSSREEKHAASVEFLMQLWRSGLDYQNGAHRVQNILANAEWSQREQQEQQALELASLTVAPGDFGWTPKDSIVVVNLSRIPEPLRRQVVLAFKACARCGEMRLHPQKPFLSFATSSKATIQYALHSSTLPLDFVWPETPVPQLLLLPLASP